MEKTTPRRYLPKALRSVAVSWAGAFLLAVALPAAAQQRYETLPVLSASKILSPDLLSGPNHRVQEKVANDGFQNTYNVGSKFGTFTVVSTISGNYVATQATFAIAGGVGELAMINEKGAVIRLTSEQSGTQLAAGPAGMTLKLK